MQKDDEMTRLISWWYQIYRSKQRKRTCGTEDETLKKQGVFDRIGRKRCGQVARVEAAIVREDKERY